MSYAAYLFDFDYTLADATSGIVESANYALKRLGYALKNREEIRKTVGLTLRETFFTLTGDPEPKTANAFAAAFKERADEVITDSTVFFADTAGVLRKLQESGCHIAVITNKFRYRVQDALEKYGMEDLVEYIIGLEDVAEAKPSPEGISKALAVFGLCRADALYIGDSLVDARAAANAGVDFAAVVTGATPAAAFTALPHVLIARSLTEPITL